MLSRGVILQGFCSVPCVKADPGQEEEVRGAPVPRHPTRGEGQRQDGATESSQDKVASITQSPAFPPRTEEGMGSYPGQGGLTGQGPPHRTGYVPTQDGPYLDRHTGRNVVSSCPVCGKRNVLWTLLASLIVKYGYTLNLNSIEGM